jgi:ubiquitin C-terminal hydrolase
MPNPILSRCFTKDHWEKPFTLDQQSISTMTKGTLCLTAGDHRNISVTFNRKQKALVFLISTVAFLCSLGILTLPAFSLTASCIKQRKIKKIQRYLLNNPLSNPTPPTPTPKPPVVPPTPTPPKIPSTTISTPANPLPNPGRLPPPPVDGILIGLPNVGNTCWLNSVLTTLACSPQRDGLFEVDVETLPAFVYSIPTGTPDAEKAKLIAQQKAAILELQRALKTVIYTLRTQKEGTIDRKLCKRLVNALPILMPRQNIQALNQQEAAEALLLFETRFAWPTNAELDQTAATEKTRQQFCQAIKLYSSLKEGQIKEARTQNFASTVSLTFKSADLKKPNERVNISDYFRQEYQGDVVETTSDLVLGEDTEKREADYTIEQVFVNLPETLSINIQRNVVISEEEALQAILEDRDPIKQKCARAIDIDANGCIVLYECDPNQVGFTEDDTRMAILPKYACTYEVATAVVHAGGANGGHYTCIERTPQGKYYDHDDSWVHEVSSESAIRSMQQSTFLTLRRVRKEELSSEQISLLMLGMSSHLLP